MNTRIFRLAAIGFALAACVGSLHSADGITWGTINLPPTGTGSTIVPFTAIATNTGTTTWDTTYALEMRDANGTRCDTEHLTTSIPPGGTATITFHLSVPASLGTYNYRFTALNSSGNFGTDQWRSIVVTDLLGGSAVGLSAYTFTTSQLPTISTLAPMPTPPTGQHKLRAKVLNVPGYPDGFHAATAWNNNGLPLDVAPPPATYASQLYWLKYDSSGNNLLEMGPFNNVSLQISQSRVQLSSYYFNSLNRPIITTDVSIPPQYKLAASVLYGNSPLAAAVSWNNQGQFLDYLPPPGSYTVQFYWQKYDIAGSTVLAISPVQTDTITVVDGSTVRLLDQCGTSVGDDAYDDDGNYVGTTYTQYAIDCTIPTPGQLRFTLGPCDFITDLQLIGQEGNNDYNIIVYHATTGEVVTVNGQPGVARMWIDPKGSGNWEVFFDLVPSAPPCTITSGSTASATLWTPFNGYQITASPVATTFYAGGLPLGLKCDPVTGVISGTPTQAGTFTVALYAANPSGIGPTKPLTLTVAKATPTLTFSGQTFSTPTTFTGNASVTGVAGQPVPTGTITYTIATGGSGNPVGQLIGFGSQMTIAATYPGDANYTSATSSAIFAVLPGVPTASRASFVSSYAFTANWFAVAGATGYRLDVSPSSGFTSYFSIYQNLDVGSATSSLVSGLTAGTNYYFRVRAYGATGVSASSNIITAATVPSSMSGSAGSAWVPVPHINATTGARTYDGLRHEVFPAGTSTFNAYIDSYREVSEQFYYFDYGNLNDYWVTLTGQRFAYSGQDIPSPDTSVWVLTVQIDSRITLWADVVGEVDIPNDGYTYAVFADSNGTQTTDPANWWPVTNEAPLDAGRHFIYLNSFIPSQLLNTKFFLVRYAKPVGSLQISDSSGNVLVDNAAVDSANPPDLWLPADGHVTIRLRDTVNNWIMTPTGAAPSSGNPVSWQILDVLGNVIRAGTGIDVDLSGLPVGALRIGMILAAAPPKNVPVKVLQPLLGVKTVNHNSGGAELAFAQKTTVGAFVPRNDDDDDYSATDTSNGADKDQSGPISGEDDLLPIVLHQVNAPGAVYTLDIPSNVRVWQNGNDRTGAVISSGAAGTTQFDATMDTTLYVEGIAYGTDYIKLNVSKGSYSKLAADQVKITVFSMIGPLNVPGYAIYRYIGGATGLSTSKWLAPVGGTIATGADTGDVNILWSEGPMVGKAVFQANENYVWDLEINVVQVLVKPGGGFTMGNTLGQKSGPGGTIITAGLTSPGMTGRITIGKIVGPNFGGTVTRGERFIDVGFIQFGRVEKQHGNYNDFSPHLQRRFSMETDGVYHLDGLTSPPVTPSQATAPPWFDYKNNYINVIQAVGYSSGKIDSDTSFVIIDTPESKGTDLPRLPYGGAEAVLSSMDIVFDFTVYFAVHSADTRNSANTIYTQRAVGSWRFDGSGTMDSSAVWHQTGTGNTTGSANNAFTPITDGSVVSGADPTAPLLNNLAQQSIWETIPQ